MINFMVIVSHVLKAFCSDMVKMKGILLHKLPTQLLNAATQTVTLTFSIIKWIDTG